MENEIIIEQGVALEFKSNLQKTYDFLNDCNTSLSNCKILEDLGFDGGNRASYTEAINNTKSEITSLLSQVTNCEEDLLALDENASDRLKSLFDETGDSSQETVSIDPTSDNQIDDNGEDGQNNSSDNDGTDTDNNNDTGNNNNNSNDTDNNNDTGSNDNGNNNNGGNNNDNGNGNDNWYNDGQDDSGDEVTTPYQFSLDHDEAYAMGDIFINEEKSLTMFTNYLLDKYGITDPDVAKTVYQAIIKYGNDYYKETGKNPLLELSEKEVMDKIYEQISYLVNDSNKDNFWDLLKNVSL